MPDTPDVVIEERCPRCRCEAVEVLQRVTTKPWRDGQAVTFTEELSHCTSCGEEFFTYDQSMAQSRAFALAVQSLDRRVMSHDRIRAVRLHLGFTLPQFERALGVGKKTVVRWERGTVIPGPAANGMLWFAEKAPKEFLRYAAEGGVTPKAAAQKGGSIVGSIPQALSERAVRVRDQTSGSRLLRNQVVNIGPDGSASSGGVS